MTRRNWFASAGLLTSAGIVAAGAAGPVEKYPRNLTKDDVDRWMTELSNWGKWGKDDQAGTINLITPAKRKAAAAAAHLSSAPPGRSAAGLPVPIRGRWRLT
jgi:hypothetical protein